MLTTLSPNRFYSINLLLPSGGAELWQPPASLEIHPEEQRGGESKAKKPQHYVVKPQSPERAERAGKSSLAALSSSEIPYGDVPSPGLAGNACRDTGAKELRRKRFRDAAGEAAQAPQQSRVTALRYVAAF